MMSVDKPISFVSFVKRNKSFKFEKCLRMIKSCDWNVRTQFALSSYNYGFVLYCMYSVAVVVASNAGLKIKCLLQAGLNLTVCFVILDDGFCSC